MAVPTAPLPRMAGPLPGSSPKPLLERGFNECSWIVAGEGADALACCLPATNESPRWCAAHWQMGHQASASKAPPSANELIGSLRRYA